MKEMFCVLNPIIRNQTKTPKPWTWNFYLISKTIDGSETKRKTNWSERTINYTDSVSLEKLWAVTLHVDPFIFYNLFRDIWLIISDLGNEKVFI